ncbi:MAG: large subunit ribosomal protein L24e [Candidatus Methanomethylophilaceae archaeon]|jgi:LSU ribosomal protein L24E|nr:large subunit ribosomal protein L24e [Candidatus Methanomethylophilaceae archaeon]MDI3541211.1 large subunit ribosomal protein L24e [Candidatus Methanomethylophilaceae archaeon]
MVEIRKCSFCSVEIEPGSGSMFVKKDGTVYHFCSKKCYKNMIEMKRVPRTTAWTKQFAVEKEARLKTIEKKRE